MATTLASELASLTTFAVSLAHMQCADRAAITASRDVRSYRVTRAIRPRTARHQPSLEQARPRHIGGTSPQDLPRGVEKWRDLNPRSALTTLISAKARRAAAQDPAYRPTCNNLAPRPDFMPRRHVSGAARSGDADALVRLLHGTTRAHPPPADSPLYISSLARL